MYEKGTRCVEEGGEVEDRFAGFLPEWFPNQTLNVQRTPRGGHEDRVLGIDVYATIGGKLFSFDVKKRKKENRSDSSPSARFHVVEWTGVSGHPGWVRKSANFVAFEEEDCFLIVPRSALENLLRQRRSKTTLIKRGRLEPEPYQLYQRPNNADEIAYVPFDDIQALPGVKKWSLCESSPSVTDMSVNT